MYFLAVSLLNLIVIFVANFVEIGPFLTKPDEVYDKVCDYVFTFRLIAFNYLPGRKLITRSGLAGCCKSCGSSWT
jgi:hypothetical protein